MAEPKSSNSAELEGAQFGIERIYLKDASFESPRSPESLKGGSAPEFKLDVGMRTHGLGPQRYEVVLSVTLRSSSDEGEVNFIVEVQQAGVFQVGGASPEAVQRTLATRCAQVLFPYVRETIDSLLSRGGMRPAHLAPLNFDVLFQEAQRSSQARH